MQLWRIAKKEYALDRSGYGAKTAGGRWNLIGTPALYTGTTVEICALEALVHLSAVNPKGYVLVSVQIPTGKGMVYTPKETSLPHNWNALPVGELSQKFGNHWLSSNRSLAMVVPSAVIPEARNVIINPAHPEVKKIKLEVIRDFAFDIRLG